MPDTRPSGRPGQLARIAPARLDRFFLVRAMSRYRPASAETPPRVHGVVLRVIEKDGDKAQSVVEQYRMATLFCRSCAMATHNQFSCSTSVPGPAPGSRPHALPLAADQAFLKCFAVRVRVSDDRKVDQLIHQIDRDFRRLILCDRAGLRVSHGAGLSAPGGPAVRAADLSGLSVARCRRRQSV
jgi:hypothetical protein